MTSLKSQIQKWKTHGQFQKIKLQNHLPLLGDGDRAFCNVATTDQTQRVW